MKTRKYIYTTLATCLFVFSSCLNDLDVLPLDPTVETADKAYTDAESYTKGLHKIYSVWALSGQDGSSSSDISGLGRKYCTITLLVDFTRTANR